MSSSTPRDHGLVRTVLGDRPASELGRCDYHEHLFQTSPLLAGDELDDEDASRREASELRAADITTMVEATPTGLGRDPAGVARISEATGLGVVHVSGAHRSEHYAAGHWLLAEGVTDLAERFTRDVRDGLPGEDVAREALREIRDPLRQQPVARGVVLGAMGTAHVDDAEPGRLADPVDPAGVARISEATPAVSRPRPVGVASTIVVMSAALSSDASRRLASSSSSSSPARSGDVWKRCSW